MQGYVQVDDPIAFRDSSLEVLFGEGGDIGDLFLLFGDIFFEGFHPIGYHTQGSFRRKFAQIFTIPHTILCV